MPWSMTPRPQMFHGSKISMAIKKLHEGRLKNRNF